MVVSGGHPTIFELKGGPSQKLKGEGGHTYLAGFSKRCSLKLHKKDSFCHKKP